MKIWLYWSGVRMVPFGPASCARISRASRPPTTKNTSAVPQYIRPSFLWSMVVNQDFQPVVA